LSVRSIRTQRDDCTRLTSGHFVLSISTSPVSKEVLFHVIDKKFNAAKTNSVIKQMLDNFIRNIIKGIYFSQNNGKHSELMSEHGDLIKLILTHDRFTGKPKKSADCRFEGISSERGDSTPKIIEIDGLNLPTFFGEPDDLTNITYNSAILIFLMKMVKFMLILFGLHQTMETCQSGTNMDAYCLFLMFIQCLT